MTNDQFIQFCEDNKIDIKRKKLIYYNKLNQCEKLQYRLDKEEFIYDQQLYNDFSENYSNRVNNKNKKVNFYNNLNLDNDVWHSLKLFQLIQK